MEMTKAEHRDTKRIEMPAIDIDWMQKIERDFYLHDGNWVAEHLLGKLLFHKTDEGLAGGIIVETEAYCGAVDKGSHAYPNKKTERTKVQFGLGGYGYVYLIYGMHYCFNVVAGNVDVPDAVLVRALEPISGLSGMRNRRWNNREKADKIIDADSRKAKCNNPARELCNGPGKLCQAMAITKEHNGIDLCGNRLYITSGIEVSPKKIMVSPRINIDYAEECIDYPWRYFIKDNRYVSKIAPRYRKMQQLLYG